MVVPDRVDEVESERTLSTGERPGGGWVGVGKRLKLRRGGRMIADRGPAEELLGFDPNQVHARVGVDQAKAALRPVGHELDISRHRLGEQPFLEGEIAEQFQRVISPGAAKSLVDDPPERGSVASLFPEAKPAFRLRVDAGPVHRAGLGRERGDPPLTFSPGIDREPKALVSRIRIGGQFDDLVAELLDHSLIDLDRLGEIAGLGVIIGAPEVGVGLVAGVEVDLGPSLEVPRPKLSLAERRGDQAGPRDHQPRDQPSDDSPRPAHPVFDDEHHDLFLRAKAGVGRRPIFT